jgi:hypothetical protein
MAKARARKLSVHGRNLTGSKRCLPTSPPAFASFVDGDECANPSYLSQWAKEGPMNIE